MAPQPVSEETETAISILDEVLSSMDKAYTRVENENVALRRENRALSIDSFRNRRLADGSLIMAAWMTLIAVAGWVALLIKVVR